MRFVDQISVAAQRVMVRADLNVPFSEGGEIVDDNRIKESIPTIKYLVDNKAKVIILSHLGDKTKAEGGMSLRKVCERLSELLGRPVDFIDEVVGPKVEAAVAALKPGQVLMLENVRFHPGEKSNSQDFSQELAKLADIYVNDAFAAAHRKHASVVTLPRCIKTSAAGLLMKRELDFYSKALEKPARPLVVVLGGAKLSTKLAILQNISKKADKIIIGGAMANTFLAAQGIQMGKSLVERELFPQVISLLAALARRDCKLYLPVDFTVATSMNAQGGGRVVTAQEIPADSMALDIGPATSLLYKAALMNAGTIVWNGPMGVIEVEQFARGTHEMIESIASSLGTKIVGGGDTDAAIHQMELGHKFDFISTGGGAFLALLEGSELPATAALVESSRTPAAAN